MLGATLNDPRITAEQLWAGSYLWTTRAEKRQRFERHSDESFSRRLRLGIDRPPLRADGWPVTETAVAGSLQSARGRRTCAFCREIARWREPLVGQRRTSQPPELLVSGAVRPRRYPSPEGGDRRPRAEVVDRAVALPRVRRGAGGRQVEAGVAESRSDAEYGRSDCATWWEPLDNGTGPDAKAATETGRASPRVCRDSPQSERRMG
jgi:hypothetical protein